MKKFLTAIPCLSMFFVVAVAICTWLQYEKPGPTGDDILVTFTVKNRHENGDLGSSSAESSIKGKILLVRLTPSGDGMDAKIQTEEGWYEFPLDWVPVDLSQKDPVVLDLGYKEGIQFRESTKLQVTAPGYLLGFRLGDGETIGSGGGSLPGDVQRVALNQRAGGMDISVDLTTKPYGMIAHPQRFLCIREIVFSP